MFFSFFIIPKNVNLFFLIKVIKLLFLGFRLTIFYRLFDIQY